MTYLLDTHTMLWAISEPEKLSPKVAEIIETPEKRILVSVVSLWEVSLKYSIGKLSLDGFLPEELPEICEKMDFDVVALQPKICATFHQLAAKHHKDPFDRMLIWQAKNLGFPILSKDEMVAMYRSEGITVIW